MKLFTTRRAFLGTTLGAVSCVILGCDSEGRKKQAAIESAAKELGQAIAKSMDSLRKKLAPGTSLYVVVLAVRDDFSDLRLYGNTEEHFAKTKRRALDRWYFGEFSSAGVSVDWYGALINHLGRVENWEERDKPENGNAVDWLVAITRAMLHARDQGAFTFNGQAATIYCSMVDSRNAIWLEDLSARFLNPADAYAAAAPGIKSASREWYQSKGDEGPSAFRAAYELALTDR
jgi:hypothetical protein